MPSLTWIHLSDWHQRGQDFDRKVVRDKLLDDLRGRVRIDSRLKDLDFAVFSGDLAFAGLPEEFQSARTNLLDPILTVTGLNRERLFMVPGNHDLRRDTFYLLPNELLKPLNTDAFVQKWLTDDKIRLRTLEPFDTYRQFVADYTGQLSPDFASIRRLTIDGVEVALLGLNSAWISARNADANGEINDYGFLLLGEPQIHDALRAIDSAEIRIAVLHHPFEWLHGVERAQIQAELMKSCHFILRGHEHEPGADWRKGLQSECMLIPAGASYDRRKPSDPRYVNAYNLVHIDLTSNEGILFLRRWSERRKEWVEDTDSVDGGQLSFHLPKVAKKTTRTREIPMTSGATSPVVQPAGVGMAEVDYRRRTVETFKDLSFKGLTASVRPILLPLEKVYVQLRAVAEVPESADEFTPEERRVLRWLEEEGRQGLAGVEKLREAQMQLDALRRERWTKERLERFPIAEALNDPGRRGLVILGDPGSGKTTLLHFLALVFARGPEAASKHLQISGSDADRLPIFAPLAAYDDMLNNDPELTVQDFLATYYAQRRAMPGLHQLFDSAIDSGRALVLLDGMDEVIDEGRRKFVADQTSAFIRSLITHGNRVLLTSRIYGYRTAPVSVDLPHVTVLDFRRDEIEVFARQWNLAMSEWEFADRPSDQREAFARAEERNLLEEIKSNPGVERLAANPLLLSMLALLRRQVGRLPQQRIRLYSLYLGALVDAWETSRSPGGRLDSPARPDVARVELVLIPLALWLQQNKPSGTATEAEVIAQIRNIFLREEGFPEDTPPEVTGWSEADSRARKFLDDMRQFSGLLVERGRGVFGFRHLTFQEYYVGRALARMDPTERWNLLREDLHGNRWREPILLAAAQLGNMQADEESCTKLVNQILNSNSEHENFLHRDLFLAADCASDDINVHITTLRNIVNELTPLTNSPIPAIANEAMRRLVGLALLTSGSKRRLPEAIDALVAISSAWTQRPTLFQKFLESVTPILHLSEMRECLLERLSDHYLFVRNPTIRTLAGLTPDYEEVHAAFLQILNGSDRYSMAVTIEAITGLLVDDAELRAAVVMKLDGETYNVRAAAIQALSGALANDVELRGLVAQSLNDSTSYIRGAAVLAIAGLLADDVELRAAVVKKVDDEASNVRAAAIRALAGLLADDVELRTLVLSKLDDESYDVRVVAIKALEQGLPNDEELRAALVRKLDDEAYSVRVEAIKALAGFLPGDRKLRTALVRKLDDSDNDVRTAAIMALAGLVAGDEGLVAAILPKLNDEESSVRAAAIQVLVPIRAQLENILNMLRHQDWRTRKDCVLALSDGIDTDSSLLRFTSAVFDDRGCLEVEELQVGAIQSLVGLVAQDAELRKVVERKVNDESHNVRIAAIRALAGLLADDVELRTLVLSKLDDESYDVRVVAIKALEQGLPNDEELRAALVRKLDDEAYSVRVEAIKALAGFLPGDRKLRTALVRKLDDSDNDVRTAAIMALAGLVAGDEGLYAAIVPKLNDEESDVRAAAIIALTGALVSDDQLWFSIVPKLGDSDADVRAASSRALAKVVADSVELRAAVVMKLDDDSPYVRAAAIQALTGLLASDDELHSAVMRKLEDGASNVRIAAIQALAGLLADDAQLCGTIVGRLDDDEASVRSMAIRVLAPLVHDNATLRAAIVRKLEDKAYNVRVIAIRSIAELIPNNTELRTAVVRKLDDSDNDVRAAAIQALAALLADDAELRAAVSERLHDQDVTVRASAVIKLSPFLSDRSLRDRLKAALRTDDDATSEEIFTSGEFRYPRRALVATWAQWAMHSSEGVSEVVEMLASEDWRLRLSGAEILAAIGGDVLQQNKVQLFEAIDDRRGLDSWPARISAAELLINYSQFSERAINLLVSALDYATDPLIIVPMATEIRQSAARGLGRLKAEEYRADVADKLKSVLRTEAEPEVLDSLFQALQSLASAPS